MLQTLVFLFQEMILSSLDLYCALFGNFTGESMHMLVNHTKEKLKDFLGS